VTNFAIREVEALAGPLANDDSNRLERFGDGLANLVLLVVKRAYARGQANPAQSPATEGLCFECGWGGTCPDCGWTEGDDGDG